MRHPHEDKQKQKSSGYHTMEKLNKRKDTEYSEQ